VEVIEMAVIEHSTQVLAPPLVDEAAARRSLREQIARLERELGSAVAGAYPRVAPPAPVEGLRGPRLLSLGELERLRDALDVRLRSVRAEIARQADEVEARRVLLEKMLANPRAYKWMLIRDEDTPSCRTWHVRPRFGLIGMLAGWWHVKLSSGCPLAVAA
jgi:hypothetical protein